jgi:hypothetical protein
VGQALTAPLSIGDSKMHILTDEFILPVVQLILLGMLCWSVWKVLPQNAPQNAPASEAAPGGNETLGYFAGGYAVSVLAVSLAVEVSTAWANYKVAFVLFDFAVLTYLFWCNSWFRRKYCELVLVLQRV